MDELIGIVNQLQDVLNFTGMGRSMAVDLPQIAVVGSQSVGKTSVLEGFVGRDFLPRGTGIVTRRPLILQLQNSARLQPSERKSNREWAEFAHLPGQIFEDFKAVRREIEADTDRVCGQNKGVSHDPIRLRVFSPTLVDLTLVDLPGITKVPVGDQPADIHQQIRDLVLQHISRRGCLILAVTAANADLANSDALQIAREVDPNGNRTLGVLTKIDLMDEGTDASAALQGQVYPLKLGYVGVICRSQADIQKNKSIEDQLKSEEAYFRKMQRYQSVQHQCGIRFLGKRLNRVLLAHIREMLPELRNHITRQVGELEQELTGYGDPVVEQRMNQGAFLLHLLSKYTRNFADAIDGKLAYTSFHDVPDRLTGGARLHFVFHNVFAAGIMGFDPFTGLSDGEIRTAIRNATGPKPQLFVPEVAFEMLIKRQIAKLEDPALQCVHLVFEELQQLAMQSEVLEMQRFANLREKTFEVAQGVMKRCLQPTNQMIMNLIQIELAHINVTHPDFIGGSRAISCAQGLGYGGASGGGQQYPPRAPQPPMVQAAAPQALPNPASERDPGEKPHAPNGQAEGNSSFFGYFNQGWGGRGQVQQEIRLPQVPQVVSANDTPSEKERMDVDIIKSLMSSYFAIVKRKVVDAVPKSIMYFMVNTVKEVLHHECVATLYRPELFDMLLTEGNDIRARRSTCQQKLECLRSAQEVLTKMRDYSF